MHKKTAKNLDTGIEKLLDEYAKADKVREDPDLLSFSLKTIKHFSEIQDFISMYKKYFIPKTNQYLVALRKVIRHSKFKGLITNEFVDLEENKNETIRLAVVGLFHKYESFNKDLVRNLNQFLNAKGIDIDVKEYAKTNSGFDIDDKWNNQSLFEVNWICNRIKHDSSLPISFDKPNRPIPREFEHLDLEKKIVISQEELYTYADSIYQYCHDLFQLFNQLNLKIQLENDGIDPKMSVAIDLDINQKITLLNNRENR